MALTAGDIENKLMCGDSLRILPEVEDGCVDAIVTDPPYSSGVKLTSDLIKGRRRPPMLGVRSDERALGKWMHLWLLECYRVARNGACLLLFCDWRRIPLFSDMAQLAGWQWRSLATWDKGPGRVRIQKGNFMFRAEFVIFATKGDWQPLNVYPDGIIAVPNCPLKKNHVTAKPVELIRKLSVVLPEGALVMDPFMGGGAVPRACVETGRKYFGIELSREYFNIASDFILEAAPSRLEPLGVPGDGRR
jgi:site-specific DNA-methyltransferase (adenine-specific)